MAARVGFDECNIGPFAKLLNGLVQDSLDQNQRGLTLQTF